MLHIFNFGVASTKMSAVLTSNCPRFLHIYCGPPPLRSMEDGTINSDERGTTSKVSTECPLTMSTHSVSTIDKVHFRESVQWTISPLHALSKGRSLKRADPLLCSNYGTGPTISSVLAIDTSSEELPRKFFREKGHTPNWKKDQPTILVKIDEVQFSDT